MVSFLKMLVLAGNQFKIQNIQFSKVKQWQQQSLKYKELEPENVWLSAW